MYLMPDGPSVALERLAAVVSALAARTTQADVRTQLHALSGILLNLLPDAIDEDERERVQSALSSAMQRGDEAAGIQAMRRLAALERGAVRPVDWSVASRG